MIEQKKADEGTVHNAIRLYAINSWSDIDLTKYMAKTARGNNIEPMMFCDDEHTKSCEISLSAWNCMDNTSECYRDGIPTFPTPMPTESPIGKESENNEEIENWAMIVGLIIGIFFFCLFVILGWIWCMKQQEKEKKKYESVDAKPHKYDPDADIMHHDHQHMYRKDIPPTKHTQKSMDIVTKSGLHIVNEYSDASKFGGLLPISEEKSSDLVDRKTDSTSSKVKEQENEDDNANEEDRLITDKNEIETGVNVLQDDSDDDEEQEGNQGDTSKL